MYDTLRLLSVLISLISYSTIVGMMKVESPELASHELISLPAHRALTVADVFVLLVSNQPEALKRCSEQKICDLDELLEPYQIPLLTALILAGYCRAAQILIDCKADVNRSSAQQMTPLFIAAAQGCVDIVVALLDAGAELEPVSWGPTPLFIAAEYGHFAVVEALLAKRANSNCVCNIGATPLIIASENGHYEVVKLLLNFGADPNATRSDGATALFLQLEKVMIASSSYYWKRR